MAIVSVIYSCTNLDETVYDQVMSENYYQTKTDIIRAVVRPLEHAFWCETFKFECEETSGDQIITPTRDQDWYDNGRWERYHSHQWNIDEGPCRISEPWKGWYTGVGQCNLVIDDLKRLNASKLGVTQEEIDYFSLQLRTLRAYYHLYLFDGYRNIIIDESSDSENIKSQLQSTPEETFNWIESELLECLEGLPVKSGTSGNGDQQGQFTKAAAASLLVRLYLNADKYIGVSHWNECIAMCKRITDGEFGTYELGENWYDVFDWDNENSNEVIFAFPSSFGGTHWGFANEYRTIYWRNLPWYAEQYLGITDNGSTNPQYALSPSYDNDGSKFDYQLGVVTQKFEKYPGDLRYKQYKNLGNNTREGMFFLEGYLRNTSGTILRRNNYDLYLLDRVGRYHEGASTKTIPAGNPTESTLHNGDNNSGLFAVKYPMYPSTESGRLESDLVEIRLPEIIYSEAECELRLGNTETAAKLLNSVRKRNYPSSYWSQVLYAPEGNATLDLDEMLDEWGREFLTEGRRRIDLIRFGKFGDAWWDKEADSDSHYEIWPLMRTTLTSNPNLKQNPGYEDITR